MYLVLEFLDLEHPQRENREIADQEMPIYGFPPLEVDRPGVQFRFQGPERLLDPPQAMVDLVYLLRLHLGLRGDEQVVPREPQVLVHFLLVDRRGHRRVVQDLAVAGHRFERHVPRGVAVFLPFGPAAAQFPGPLDHLVDLVPFLLRQEGAEVKCYQ